MDDVLGAVALEQARGDRAALAGRADRRHRPRRVEAVGQRVEVVVGDVERARDVARAPTRCARARRGSAARGRAPSARAARAPSTRSIARDGAALLAPARHPAGEVAGDVRDADGLGELGGARARRRRRGRRRRPAGRGRRATPGASRSRARSAVMQTAPGMCASSNCSSVRTSTTSAPASLVAARPGAASAAAACDLAGPQRAAVDARRSPGSSAAAGRGGRARRATNASSSRSARAGVVRALEADRRGDLHVHPRPAAQRAAEVPGPDLGVVGQREQPLVQRAEDRRARRRSGSIARSGRAMSPTNSVSPVSTAHGGRGRARCRSARTPCARGGGRACGAARTRDARRARAPSRRRTARARTRRRRRGGRGSSRRSRRARRPCPETWSAWLCVSSTCSIATPR